jgi:2-polyprenyl-3-methyl-5-hydroxy-6-metoxy-1,4-benzoquinol methylase
MNEGEAFLEAMDQKARMLARGARATCEANKDLCYWLLDPLARWAEAAYGKQIFEDAARGYASYCIGVAQAQRIYEKAGRYTPEAMPEIMSGVYEDEGYMVPYMWAAILIYAFWPSMVNHLAMFRNDFLRRLPANARILELACGHGVLSLLAAEERPDIQVEGLDISPPAIAVAERLLKVSGHSGNVKFGTKDALQANGSLDSDLYQGIISAMLAEHLPEPKPLFSAMGRMVSKDGLVYFSTAIESAQRDHVYEYNQESEPLQMAEAAGLRVSLMVSDAGQPSAGGQFLPRATAMILHRR